MKKKLLCYLSLYVFLFGIFYLFFFLGITLTKPFSIIGGITILICALLDRTLLNGTGTRANFYLDKYTKSSNTKIANIFFVVGSAFLLPAIVCFFTT